MTASSKALKRLFLVSILVLPALFLFATNWNQILLKAATGNYQYVKKALFEGADINYREFGGYTPLMLAVIHGQNDIARLLVDNAAYLEARSDLDETPLILALVNARTKIVDLLIKGGAQVDSPNRKGETPLYTALSYGGNLSSIQLLIDQGANVNHQDNQGFTPLMTAVRFQMSAYVDCLLKNGADTTIKNKLGETVYDIAIQTGNSNISQILNREATLG